MTILGIGLIVTGFSLLCGALILWPRASRTGEEQKPESRTEEEKREGVRASKTGSEADPVSELADLLGRLNQTSDDDPFR